MRNIPLVVILCLILGACGVRSHSPIPQSTTVAFYNVENLFDTINNQGERDLEFTPHSKKEWTSERFHNKVDDIGRVLSEVGGNSLPGMIGICEVENYSVLQELVQNQHLAKGGYRIVHEESPDYRGIDVALLYRPYLFKEISHEAIPVTFSDSPGFVTRDILYAVMMGKKKDTIHVFINHWPSRLGGMKATESKRLHAAGILKEKVDSILFLHSKAKIIIMGDMNDESHNQSLAKVLKAGDKPSANGLHNLMAHLDNKGEGSYNYRGSWSMLDHIIVSNGLLAEGKGWKTSPSSGKIHRCSWMEYSSKEGEIYPFRTYLRRDYLGGISDHFPVYFTLSR